MTEETIRQGRRAEVDLGRLIIEEHRDDYALAPEDFGKMLMMRAAGSMTFTLPAARAEDVGLAVALVKRGAGDLIIQAGEGDVIQDLTPAGAIHNDFGEETAAFVRLRIIEPGMWMIEGHWGGGWRPV